MKEIPNGTLVEQMDSVMGSDRFYWHKIHYRGSVGWARGDYLCGGVE
jgi:hypothetical protein